LTSKEEKTLDSEFLISLQRSSNQSRRILRCLCVGDTFRSKTPKPVFQKVKTRSTTALTFALRFVFQRNLKIAWAVAVALIGITFFVAQNGTLTHLREENRSLREQLLQEESLNKENARLSTLGVDPAESERQRQEHSELLRLRAEIGQLKRETAGVSCPEGS
jgi:hypothetical protein